MTDGEDTEVLLGLLSSLVNPPLPSQEQLFCALINAGGNVASAAAALNSKKSVQVSTRDDNWKRKRGDKLDGWVVNKKRQGDINDSRRPVSQVSSPSRTKGESSSMKGTTEEPIVIDSGDEEGGIEPVANRPNASPVKKKAIEPASLMSILKQAPTSSKSPLRLPPRTLGTPTLVAQNTPCTLHYSILPPELACRLFYAMLREASHWSRNKWCVTAAYMDLTTKPCLRWLFDRLVESPHRTSFYARSAVDIEDEEVQEAARYWFVIYGPLSAGLSNQA
jgi:hypothetical protein